MENLKRWYKWYIMRVAGISLYDNIAAIRNFILSTQVPPHLADDENVRKDIINLFHLFDEYIVDLRVEVIKKISA